MLKKGVKFYITDPSENARNVFRTTSLHLIIPIYSNNNDVFKEKR
jgi:anti-anti-sigma regulatory factor